jgi:serine/threonine protein kinase/Tol biopolymer transport system component
MSMTPELYQRIGDLYHAALELKPEYRADFIEQACFGDAELRREVESLLASHERASDFFSAPALAVAAGLLAETQLDSLVGQTISHYRILSLLGAGGMGEVYLAEDRRLGRRVAVKLLPAHLTGDREYVRRFTQEARATSALNHPNIITIHEIGEVKGRHFIATEYVEGETLRARLARERMKIDEVVEVGVQIAGALAAAHRAGVVHRDVKPENVMLREDGIAKVLDFGLAKLTQRLMDGSEVSTATLVKTNPGVVMGTVQYMSPEQARGLEVDARTDLWSLGCVLYEMSAGRVPFEGATSSDVIVSILEREPQPLARRAPAAPAELESIVTKALTKVRDERYQTSKEMLSDLRQLRRRLESEVGIERSHQSTSNNEVTNAAGTDGRSAAVETKTQAARRVSEAGAARTTSSLEYVVSEIKRHKRGAVLTGVALIFLLSSVGYVLNWLVNRPGPAVAAFQTTKMTRLTATGKALDAAISPDGKYVVYVEQDNKQQSLWVRQVATGSTVQIVPPADVMYFGLTFSNDSDYVYYVKAGKDDSLWALYQVPSLGGASKKVIERADSAVAFSPDGKRFAFLRADQAQGETALVIINVDGSGEQTLATRKAPDFFLFEGIVRLAWSPDGKIIACPAGSTDANGIYYNVVGVRVEDGATQLLTSQRWGWVSQVAWLSDGSGLTMVAMEEEVSPQQLWRLSYPDGEARQITNDLNRYNDVSLTRDSKSLVTVRSNRGASNIWIAPEGDAGSAKQITSGTADTSLGLSWTSDGKIVYQSDASGKPDIFVMNADGSDQRQLTHEGYSYRPAVSPAGRHVVFHSFRAGKTNIWRMDVDGGNPKQLTNGKRNFFPDISPDGQWVVYASFDSGEVTLWKVSINGGDLVQLNDIPANLPTISPDGKQIASFYWDERANPRQGVMIFPFAGGQPTRRFDILPDAINGFALDWSTDGRAILHLREDLLNIWSQPVDGGKASQLTNFKGDQIFNFAWSQDGKWLALARGRVAADVLLISDLR